MDNMIKKLVSKKWLLPVVMGAIIYFKSLFLLFTLYGPSLKVFYMSLLSIAPIGVIVSFSLLFSGRNKLKYFFIMDLFYSVLFYADMTYFSGLNRLFSIYVLYLKNISTEFVASTSEYFLNFNFLVFIDLPLVFLIMKNSKKVLDEPEVKKYKLAKSKKRRFFATAFGLSFILMVTQFFTLTKTKALENYENLPLLLSPVGNHMINMATYISDTVKTLNEEELDSIDNYYKSNASQFKADEKYEDLKGILKGKNIIAIHFESLEGFTIGYEREGKEITPNLNRIIENSVYFSQVKDQTREGVSSDAELMFNTGLFPTQKGSAFMSYGENNFFALPKLLKSEGYETMALHGDKASFWNRDIVYPNLGIDHYYDEEKFLDKRFSGLGLLDESLFKQSLIETEKAKNPYYAYVMTVTSHTPFLLEKEHSYLGLTPTEDDTANDIGYLESIHYTDHFLGEFYDQLERDGELDNTAIVIFGDHEGIHKYHETKLPENHKNVPFIVHIPGMEKIEVNALGGQIDMLPTLLYMLGQDEAVYSDKVLGSNLLREGAGYVVMPTGKVLGHPLNLEHLADGPMISNLIITGDYFKDFHYQKGIYPKTIKRKDQAKNESKSEIKN